MLKKCFFMGVTLCQALAAAASERDIGHSDRVIAHELAHLELSPMKDKPCEAVALAGDESVPLTGRVASAAAGGGGRAAFRRNPATHRGSGPARTTQRRQGGYEGDVSKLLLACCVLVQALATTAFATEAVHPHQPAQERCIASTERTLELEAASRLQAQRVRQAPAAEVPPQFHAALARLSKVARLPKGTRVELAGVHAGHSAYVLSSGTIVLSSRLWRDGAALDAEEAAALIAHELAHLELAHVKERLCEAVVAAGDVLIPFAAATAAARRVAWAGDDQLAVRLMQGNHLRELEADRRGAELLRLAGLAPGALGRMLLKLAHEDRGGYSGSHPALETRLENLGLRVGH